MTTEICRCEWTDVGSVALKVPVMTRRDPRCLNHGDGSEWWIRTQEHARALGAPHGPDRTLGEQGEHARCVVDGEIWPCSAAIEARHSGSQLTGEAEQ